MTALLRYAPSCSVYFKLLSVTSQVRKAQGYFNKLQVKRSPFVYKSMILKEKKIGKKKKEDNFDKDMFSA